MKVTKKKTSRASKPFFLIWLGTCAFALIGISLLPNWGLIKARNTNRAVVKQLGFTGYAAYESYTTVRSWLDEQRLAIENGSEYREFLKQVADERTSEEKEIQKKNVIYLQLESVDGPTVTASVDGKPVMPFLNSLTKQSLYLPNTIDNTGSGRTTDGEFLALCSLPPVPGKPVYNNYDLSKIPSMPKVLADAGYQTFSMHGNEGNFWNRSNAHQQLGYQNRYYADSLDQRDIIGWGISDKSLLEQAALTIKSSTKPVFAHLILLTHHHPYNHVGKKFGHGKNDLIEDELDSLKYVDESIETFFSLLESYSLLEDTIIAIYSDHDSATEELLRKRYNTQNPPLLSDTVPLIIYGLETAPETNSKVCSLMDLPIIVLEELGLPIPHTFAGNSVRSNRPALRLNSRLISKELGEIKNEAAPITAALLTKIAILHPGKLKQSQE